MVDYYRDPDEEDDSVDVDCPQCGDENATYDDNGLDCPTCNEK